MSNAAIADPYRVKSGDTLSRIAKQCGRSVGDLKRLNKLANPNRLEVGQTLYLSEQTAFGVTVLFLDALRHPIENLAYQLRFDGKTAQGATGAAGTTPRQITKDAKSAIEVWMRNLEGQWQQVGEAVSGYGHKLLTAVSPYLIVPGKTERHPSGAPLKPEAPATPKPAPVPQGAQAPKPASGTPTKNNPPVKTQPAKGPQGQPVLKIGVDLPEGLMQLFQNYTGAQITDDDWTDIAANLVCEKEVLKSIAQVETKGAAFKRVNSHNSSGVIPTILYERHIFHRLTCANGPEITKKNPKTGKKERNHGKGVAGCLSPHDKYPDICYPSQFAKSKDSEGHSTLHTANQQMPDGTVEATDQYGDAANSYLRLINAYRLDADAAVKACSWGKFQIMGNEHQASCGIASVKRFVQLLCTSEVKQLELLQLFIEHKAGGKLLKAVREKDWAKIALYYNGPGDVPYYEGQLKKSV